MSLDSQSVSVSHGTHTIVCGTHTNVCGTYTNVYLIVYRFGPLCLDSFKDWFNFAGEYVLIF